MVQKQFLKQMFPPSQKTNVFVSDDKKGVLYERSKAVEISHPRDKDNFLKNKIGRKRTKERKKK